MAGKQWELLEERTLSGRGLFRIPPNDAYRHFYLYVNVVRLPRVNWTNSKFNPDKSEYAKITWIRNQYVLREDALNYENQLFEYSPDPGSGGYIVQGMVCQHETILAYLDYLAPFVSAPPLPPGQPIPIEPLRNTPTEIKIVCRESTALVCKLYYIEYEEACSSATSTPKPPPDPEPVEQQLTPVPIENISPPYEEPDDNGDTQPYQNDETVEIPGENEPPIGQDGDLYRIQFQYDAYRPADTLYDSPLVDFVNVRAPIQAYGIANDLTPYGSPSVGAYAIGTNGDGSDQNFTQGFGFPGFASVTNIRNIVITKL